MRVLSLDGGGTWALLEAMALAALYPGETGRQVLAHFDIAAGNSGGAIVLGALLSDMSPAQIVALLEDPATLSALYSPHHLGIARWSAAAKLTALRTLLPEASRPVGALGALTACRILIPAYDIDGQQLHLFDSRGAADETPLALAAHASSSAPLIYFDDAARVGALRLWDGGVAAVNNPVTLAVMAGLADGAEQIAALSIGTGSVWRPARPAGAADAPWWRQEASTSLEGEVALMARAILADPPDEARRVAHALTGRRLVRLSPAIRPVLTGGTWALPAGWDALGGAGAFARLVAMDMDATASGDIALIRSLGEQWLAGSIPNQAAVADLETGECIAGQPTFPEASWVWENLSIALSS